LFAKKLLEEKIQATSIIAVKEDVRRFIEHDQRIDIWLASYFHDLVEKMKFE